MTSKDIDWSEPHDDIDFSCPYCGGDGLKCWEDLDKDEKKEVIEECDEFKEWYDLEPEEKLLVVKAFCETEDRNESDRITPKEEDLIDYYEDNTENFKFVDNDAVEDFYEDDKDSFDFHCEECNGGYLEPMMDYAYPLEYTDVSIENKKIALSCGLFLFEDDDGVWMSLTGGGMDCSPDILKAYRLLESYIPFEWATQWRQDYHAGISKEDHKLNAEECKKSIECELRGANDKLKAINLYLKDPEYVKQKTEEKMEKFNSCLNEASDIDDPLIKGLVGFSCLLKSDKEITE